MITEAWALLDAGDIPGLLGHLRFNAESMEQAEVARLLEGAAARSGFDDLREAAAAVAADPARPQTLYAFGHACVERGVSFLAVPALRSALTMAPRSTAVLNELVAALEDEVRHAEAVTVLDEHTAILRPWPDRYLVAYNALMAGDLARATGEAERLSVPKDDHWLPARDRLARMLARAHAIRAVSPLDAKDLRGWHFVLSGGVLATLSPYGFDAGMTGRYAYMGDGYGGCRRSLDRLRLILAAAGREPKVIGLLPDRSSHILGLAAARVLGLPAEPFAPGRPDTLVVAYNLNETDVSELWERTPGQVLFEHATCWTTPAPVSADVSGFLHQAVTEPWGEGLRQGTDGSLQRIPPDERPVEELADEIVQAAPLLDEGDGATPPDRDEALHHLVALIRDHWLSGPRSRVRSPGPVPSSRFL
ncbi:hypothetical protein [Actinomadura rugatobispora]|uniref:Tetratricopeptide repeat protein n=1 Tax=Actinomadura rugatobispora TaxID=1994 RepID=A0ABW0ZWC4_9ACTN|nr:hypothetical protein GCM10010200_076290 [Actinomadura rugatobispora]